MACFGFGNLRMFGMLRVFGMLRPCYLRLFVHHFFLLISQLSRDACIFLPPSFTQTAFACSSSLRLMLDSACQTHGSPSRLVDCILHDQSGAPRGCSVEPSEGSRRSVGYSWEMLVLADRRSKEYVSEGLVRSRVLLAGARWSSCLSVENILVHLGSS